MTALDNQLARQESEEIARGVRLLLAGPLLVSGHDRDDFDLVRRRRVPLDKWFDCYCAGGSSSSPDTGTPAW